MRQIRKLNFRETSREVVAVPSTVRNISRDSRTWEITTSIGELFTWFEGNELPLVLSEITENNPVRSVAHFQLFDVMAAIRSRRILQFTTGAVVTLAIPTSIHNSSRNGTVWTLNTTNGEFSWGDENAGPTVIAEV